MWLIVVGGCGLLLLWVGVDYCCSGWVWIIVVGVGVVACCCSWWVWLIAVVGGCGLLL